MNGKDDHERSYLVARDSCPSMAKSLYSGDERYLNEDWSTFGDMWNHGDWTQQDEDGFWFLHGRADDTLNVAGHKVGPAEVEGAAMEHDAVNQVAAVGVPDDTTGTAVVLYIIAENGYEEMTNCVKKFGRWSDKNMESHSVHGKCCLPTRYPPVREDHSAGC